MHRILSSFLGLITSALLLQGCAEGERPGPDAGSLPPAALPAPTRAAEANNPGEIDLSSLGYSRGSPTAPVTVVEFSDFGCPYCAKFALESLPQLQQEFIESGKVRWQYVPFELGIFPNGGEAARAGECAGEQDRFWEMHDLLYQRQREWKASDTPETLFRGFAQALGLDVGRFASCYQENRPAERIALNNEVTTQLGVRATPSFLVNGRPVEGALPLEQFRMLLQWAGTEAQPR